MKKFFKAAAVAAIIAFAGVNVFNANHDVQLSDLQMENVEALAIDECCVKTVDKVRAESCPLPDYSGCAAERCSCGKYIVVCGKKKS